MEAGSLTRIHPFGQGERATIDADRRDFIRGNSRKDGRVRFDRNAATVCATCENGNSGKYGSGSRPINPSVIGAVLAGRVALQLPHDSLGIPASLPIRVQPDSCLRISRAAVPTRQHRRVPGTRQTENIRNLCSHSNATALFDSLLREYPCVRDGGHSDSLDTIGSAAKRASPRRAARFCVHDLLRASEAIGGRYFSSFTKSTLP